MDTRFDTIITAGRVIDRAQRIDGKFDVGLKNGKIAAIGTHLQCDGSEIIDVAGYIVCPGLVDIHVHVYGILGFAYPDRVGIGQGVTTFVEPGGPGVACYEEFKALMEGRIKTTLYCGPYVTPLGLCGLEAVEGNIRNMIGIQINDWLDVVGQNRDNIRYLKVGALSNFGAGLVKLAKGLADILELPLYVHLGDLRRGYRPETTPTAFRMASEGDIITHIYHNNPGTILDANGKIIPELWDAQARGVNFDIGFGSLNFSFEVAEKAMQQGVLPSVLSSDLQQVNVTGPTYSLANVMSIFLALGMSIEDVIERVTCNAARSIGLGDRHGTLEVGKAADVTVLEIETGDFELTDCWKVKRKAQRRIRPVMVFKNGTRHEVDLMRAQDKANWDMQFDVAPEEIPDAARELTAAQRSFLTALRQALSRMEWRAGREVDMRRALEIHACFHDTRAEAGLPLKDALLALFACLFDRPFTYQAAMAINRQSKPFLLRRLEAVAKG